MKKLGLIGKNISYSYSKKYFENKFKELELEGYFYEIFDIDNLKEIDTISNNKKIIGLNVTIPYKVKIIDYLDELSQEANAIGAVNTIKIHKGRRIGYNTDAYGFEFSLHSIVDFEDDVSALILGDGGAAKAVKYIFNKHKIPYTVISRKGKVNFTDLSDSMVFKNKLIIQCTPVGTYPNINDSVKFPFHALTPKHRIIDLIYNPEKTQFMKNAEEFGAKTMNGLLMLEQQAEKAWEIWTKE